MATIITRLYADKAAGEAAVAALKDALKLEKSVALITSDTAPDAAGLQAAAEAQGVYSKAAASYAAHVADGKALVVAYGAFGVARTVMDVLDAQNPLEVDVPRADVYTSQKSGPRNIIRTYGSASIIRDGLMLSGSDVLTKGTTPFSSLFRMSPLGKFRLPMGTKTSNNRILPFGTIRRVEGKKMVMRSGTIMTGRRGIR